jgi:hypothetical protein
MLENQLIAGAYSKNAANFARDRDLSLARNARLFLQGVSHFLTLSQNSLLFSGKDG